MVYFTGQDTKVCLPPLGGFNNGPRKLTQSRNSGADIATCGGRRAGPDAHLQDTAEPSEARLINLQAQLGFIAANTAKILDFKADCQPDQ